MITKTMRKGLVVAALHAAIVGSLGAKLLIDRATRPRVWVRTAPVDPDLPIRGRYVRLAIEAVPSGSLRSIDPRPADRAGHHPITLSVQNGQLVAVPSPVSRQLTARILDRAGEPVAVLNQPLAYFIPEHVDDPSRRAPGEELWVEVTIPRAGAPRPIRLGVKRDGVLTALDVE